MSWDHKAVRLARCFLAAITASAAASIAHAQSFDCARARTTAETAICASSELRALDNRLAGVFARSLFVERDNPAALQSLRAAQRKFVETRDRECVAGPALEKCLIAAYRNRLEALASDARPQEDRSQQAAAKDAASKEAGAKEAQPPQQPASANSSYPLAANKDGVVAPQATAAAGASSALVTIEQPGRYAIRAQSASGVALQWVDMMTGPGARAGVAGQRDGRLDLLLDAGAYKLRVEGADGAKGEARLTAQAFREVLRADLGEASQVTQLRDFQQASFWIEVGPDGRIGLEAMGRALADLRLWRDGEALVDLAVESATVEPQKGRLMTRLRAMGAVAPGKYLVAAYGGPPRIWSDGADDHPLTIRRVAPQVAAAGVFEGALSPLGSAFLEAPAHVNALRLELAAPADVRLTARRSGAAATTIHLSKSDRDSFAVTTMGAGSGPVSIEIDGAPGQKFRLSALQNARTAKVTGEGDHLVYLDVAGEGGDEAPATAVLARVVDGKATKVAAAAPRIGPGQPWRKRFNLRGPTALIFEVAEAGPLALAAKGALDATLEPTFGGAPLTANAPGKFVFDVEPGFYTLRLTPPAGQAGVVDVTFGPPGLQPQQATPSPARNLIALGQINFEKGGYEARSGGGPAMIAGLRVTPMPAQIDKAPLALWQEAAPRPEPALAPAPQGLKPQENSQPAPTKISAPTGARAPAAKPARSAPSGANNNMSKPTQVAATAPAQKPAARRPPSPQPLSARVRAPLGGRILVVDQTGANVQADFADEKADAKTRDVTVRVAPSEKARALAVLWRPDASAAPAATVAVAPERIDAGAPTFFDLPKNGAREFFVDVKEGGLYRVETLGRLATAINIGAAFTPKLAEALANGAGHNGLAQTYLRAGRYRVRVSAEENSFGRVGLRFSPARLRTLPALADGGRVAGARGAGEGLSIPVTIASAGAYQFDFYALERDPLVRLEDAEGWPITPPQRARAMRVDLTPGQYRLAFAPETNGARVLARLARLSAQAERSGHGPFDLPFENEQKNVWREPADGAARAPDVWRFTLAGAAHVSIRLSDGMSADLIGPAGAAARIAAGRPFEGKLEAGEYRIEARATARDDKLEYQINLSSKQWQPGAPKFVTAPAKLEFALAKDGPASMTFVGRKDVSAVLRDSAGLAVARLAGRPDDFTLAYAGLLKAGAYFVELSPTLEGAREARSGEDDEEAQQDEARQDGAGQDRARPEESDDKIEARLVLPRIEARQASDEISSAGDALAQWPAPNAAPGALIVASAIGEADLALALEEQDANGVWRLRAQERGRAPFLAWPSNGDGARRLSVWGVDGAPARWRAAARVVNAQAQSGASLAWSAVPALNGEAPLHVARVAATPGALVNVAGARDLWASSTPGAPVVSVDEGAVAPQSTDLWLATRTDQARQIEIKPAQAAPAALTLAPAQATRLALPSLAREKLRLVIAHVGEGDLGLDGGGLFAASGASRLAPVLQDGVKFWNAGGERARADLEMREVTLAADAAAQERGDYVLAPQTAQRIPISAGDRQLRAQFGKGVALFSIGARTPGLWAQSAPASALIATQANALLAVNLGDAPAPLRIARAPEKANALTPASIVRTFGAGGGFVAGAVDAQAGDLMRVIGGAARIVADGRASAAQDGAPLEGPAGFVFEHGPGLAALWIERNGETIWTKAATKNVAAPAELALDGAGQNFVIANGAPALLEVETDGPALMRLESKGEVETLALAEGARLQRFVRAGDVRLSLLPAFEGALSGQARLRLAPAAPLQEGRGATRVIGPGGAALYVLDVQRDAELGLGFAAEPDVLSARLYDKTGAQIGEGVSQIKRLQPGLYYLEARAPRDIAVAATPVAIGLKPPPGEPPADAIEDLLAAAGLKPKK